MELIRVGVVDYQLELLVPLRIERVLFDRGAAHEFGGNVARVWR